MTRYISGPSYFVIAIAAAVKDVLVSRFHIAADRLTTVGFGAARPKATNDCTSW